MFGERLIMQKPEDMELFPAEEKGFSYLMLFSDDVKMDLTLLSLDLVDEYFTRDKLVKLLLDKDNRICQPPVPTDIDYHCNAQPSACLMIVVMNFGLLQHM